MLFSRNVMTHQNPTGFYAPPASRPPTRGYDRESFVLVVSKNDDVLKFLKVHLNRFFSHIVVHKSYTEGFAALKEREFDLVLVQANPQYKPTMEFVRRMGTQHRSIPIIIIDPELAAKPEDFPGPLVVDVVAPPFDLETLHNAIRRGLEARTPLKELNEEMPPRSNFGDIVRSPESTALSPKSSALVEAIRGTLNDSNEE